MRLFEERWTPESADRWTRHDVIAAIISPLIFVATAAGSAWAILGDLRGWFLLAAALGGSLLLWAIIDRKLRAQSVAFAERENAHKETIEDRQTWED
ncbi:MAG TPA: hypothetical protein VI818_01145 [Candidatus Thermoplasmatota archaeon]|nr:hypothetical protein [Candidatus Thermoplasmatota archaeon]